eukprot:598299-Hanusia_phi.AAC.1
MSRPTNLAWDERAQRDLDTRRRMGIYPFYSHARLKSTRAQTALRRSSLTQHDEAHTEEEDP